MKQAKSKQLETKLYEGNVWNQLLCYALPMVAASLLQSVYGLTDMIIVGRSLGSGGISAVNNGSQVMLIITKIAIGITTGGSVLISQYFGRNDERGKQIAERTLMIACMVTGTVLSVVMFLISGWLMERMGAPALGDATAYLRICSLGTIFIFGFNGICAVLRGLGNSKYPMYFTIITTVVNVVLDLLLINVFHLGVSGAAAATAASQGIAFLCGAYCIVKFRSKGGAAANQDKKSIREYLKNLLIIFKIGIPCSIQMTIAGISWLVVTFLINKYGVNASAGNGISIKIKDFVLLFVHAMANSAVAMIGQAIGAGRFDKAKEVMYCAMKVTVAVSAVIVLIIELFAPQLAGIFTTDPDILQYAALNLRVEIVSQLFYAVFLIYHALAIGSGHSLFALASSFTNSIVVRVVLCTVLEQRMGLMGIYIGCLFAPVISIPMGYAFVRSERWKKQIISKKDA